MAFTDIPATVDLRKYIEVRLMGNKPHIRGRRLPVAVLAATARDNNLNAESLASAFDISTAQALAALLYYEENRALIDDQERAELAQVERWMRQT